MSVVYLGAWALQMGLAEERLGVTAFLLVLHIARDLVLQVVDHRVFFAGCGLIRLASCVLEVDASVVLIVHDVRNRRKARELLMHLQLLFLLEYRTVCRIHSLIIVIRSVAQAILAEVPRKARLRREDVVLIALLAVLRILGRNTYLLLNVVDVSELGVGILAKHQGRFHEGGPGRLTSQAKVQKRSVVHVLRVPADATVQLLLVGEHRVGCRVVCLHV